MPTKTLPPDYTTFSPLSLSLSLYISATPTLSAHYQLSPGRQQRQLYAHSTFSSRVRCTAARLFHNERRARERNALHLCTWEKLRHAMPALCADGSRRERAPGIFFLPGVECCCCWRGFANARCSCEGEREKERDEERR